MFNTVAEAVAETGADVSIVFVPPAFAADALMEAADAGIKVIVAITEGIPVADMVKVKAYIDNRDCTLIGPNCPGIITAGQAKVGIMPGFIFDLVSSASCPSRHDDLRSGGPVHEGRPRPNHGHRHRWRPHHRHHHPRGGQAPDGGRRNEGHRDDR